MSENLIQPFINAAKDINNVNKELNEYLLGEGITDIHINIPSDDFMKKYADMINYASRGSDTYPHEYSFVVDKIKFYCILTEEEFTYVNNLLSGVQ